MKIAFIVEKFPVLTETFILNQAVGLLVRGHQVDIYARQTDDTPKVHPDVLRYDLLSSTYYAPSLPKNYLWRLLKAISLAVKFRQSYKILLQSLNFLRYGRRAASLRLFYLVIPFLTSQPYDIIHCQFGMFAIEGVILREIGAIKGKIVTSFRGYDISWYVQEYGDNVYKNLFRKGDFFLANCQFFRNRAVQLGCDQNKILVHGSGIDCSRFAFQPRSPSDTGKIKIVTIGRLIEKKGIEYGIRAVAKVINQYLDEYPNINIEYNIIGGGCLQEHLQKLIHSLNMNGKINLLGQKHQQEIIEILDHSHIFIAPSVTAKDGNQDAPVNTLKEAMAMGLPVIATIHGGIPELVQDGISGFLVPERNVDAIAEKIRYLIEHQNIWHEIGKAGRSYVEKHYDINKLNEELVEIYERVRNNLHTRQQFATSKETTSRNVA
ncbi:MAG: glycosyltransferase [Calothrix sp. C42_A2020_038]|nr:glycosyltransferase [Calothrix sp. C42_A2020_038]